MNIHELDSYNLADAVKFNEKLNPRIWQGDKMKAPVRAKLLQIAEDFKQSLGLSDLEVKDITVSGSNAGYTYTPNSDIDLHLVVDLPQADASEVYRELFDAKKFQYNETHNISIGGYDVELYVENANTPPVSQGMYSVAKDDWINIPKKRRSTVNDDAVKSKYDVIKHRIESAIASKNFKRISNTASKIKKMRQAGLDRHGELGPENLAYKMLRAQGTIKALYDARTAAQDKKLSLKEQPKPRVTYGFREDVGITPDGVSASTKMFLSETDDEQTVADFIKDTVEFLSIETMPAISLHSDSEWGEQNQSFGRYDPETNELHVNLANRHIMDVLRTTAHELAHCRQHEISELPFDAGETGSPWENEANAVAGIVMRHYANKHPEMFQGVDLNENASGYIPRNKKEAKDPRYSMALTVDIKPGQVGKEANKLGLQTDSQGKPALLMKSANLREGRMPQPSQGPGKYRDLNEPLGPESPPKMPSGTIKVDVSDTQDWYQLGQDISNLKLANKDHYNQGPPHTVISFGSEELEHMYSKDLKRLGLPTHDLDEPGEEDEDLDEQLPGKHLHNQLAEELAAFKEQDLFEVKMTSKNLANLAKDIKGAKVGLEFEMIVPNVSNDDEYSNQEPDYDQDERVRDIDDAVNFFDDGDYNGRNEIRRLRERMESDYFDWQSEKIDERWHSDQGLEFFSEYLDREDPFDDEEAEEEARNELQAQYGDEISTEDFEKMLVALVDEKRQNYAQEQWDEQGRNYDNAQEEFSDEQRDDVSESEWLSDQNIRFASDVESNYSDVTWPYYTSNSDSEGDIENVALDFMNAMGMDTVAISSSYHGTYKKWAGNGWVMIGNNKPDDCFTIEPDGSLEGDDDSDTGLEFVSPPIPLEDIGTVMSKVQNWAGNYGAYTGDQNKTSIHTNISIPGYDLDKLDYLKAALLLGDEYVLREFDRIGNTYAAPAIEKVRALVKQKPEKAQELLDKMKSQLNAEASKLIHSGQTNKFTSINTKDNRVEFRSPGGDYLSIIADNPQKMVDTINRMVVTLDAAMDPDKYKEEYQKKLYKMLTGQQSGREAESGAKREIKKDDKDLLNIFSRYAAGELPRAALKSFVRQAQLERKARSGKETAQAPAEQGNWGIWINANDRFANQPGSYSRNEIPPLIRFPTQAAAEQWIEQQRAERPNMRADIEVREIESAEPVPGSTLDLQRQRAAQQGVDTSIDYELYNRATGEIIDTFPARNDDEARVRLYDYRNLGAGQSAPEEFGVRRGPGVTNTASSQRSNATTQTPDQAQDGIIDVEPDVAQNFTPQTLTRPGQGQQVFTGEWQVLANGEEVYRFSGVGNNQGDANIVAARWLRNNPEAAYRGGISVYPVMGEQ